MENTAELTEEIESHETAASPGRPASLSGRPQAADPPPNQPVLDSLEQAIIAQLLEDGRKPFQAIAREFDVDEKTIRNRYAKLRQRGLLQVVPTTSAGQLGSPLAAAFGVKLNAEYRTRAEETAGNIAALKNVSWVGVVLGRYDLLVEALFESRDRLARFQMEILAQVPGVADIEGFVVLAQHGKRGIPYVDGILGLS